MPDEIGLGRHVDTGRTCWTFLRQHTDQFVFDGLLERGRRPRGMYERNPVTPGRVSHGESRGQISAQSLAQQYRLGHFEVIEH
jgi:hypothetical protein